MYKQISDVKKKKSEINKTGGINSGSSVFGGSMYDSGAAQEKETYAPRVDALANRGPLMDTRIHTQNSNELNIPRQKKEKASDGVKVETKVRSEEKRELIKAQSMLEIFKGDVMKDGEFDQTAKEAARLFFIQVEKWAGSFEDGGTGFYKSMGINNVLDCLYVDGMSLRSYVKEQYFYKGSGDAAVDEKNLKIYLALLAARGDHVITLVRPNMKENEASVEFKNMELNRENLNDDNDQSPSPIQQKGNQIRSNLKDRMEKDMIEQTGIAFRKARGINMDGFTRLESAKGELDDANEGSSDEYKTFRKSFDRYYGGLQKLGLKPGRDDIDLATARELKKRCRAALDAADRLLTSGADEAEAGAVKRTKQELETDLKLINKAIETGLDEENAKKKEPEQAADKQPPKKGASPTISLNELLDSTMPEEE